MEMGNALAWGKVHSAKLSEMIEEAMSEMDRVNHRDTQKFVHTVKKIMALMVSVQKMYEEAQKPK